MEQIKKLFIVLFIASIISCLCYFGSVGPDYGYVKIISVMESELFQGVTFSLAFNIVMVVLAFSALYACKNVMDIKSVFKFPILIGILALASLICFLSNDGFGNILDIIGFFPKLIIISDVVILGLSIFTVYIIKNYK